MDPTPDDSPTETGVDLTGLPARQAAALGRATGDAILAAEARGYARAAGQLYDATTGQMIEIPRDKLASPPPRIPADADPATRLQRIGEIHSARDNQGRCHECGKAFPCVTYQLAAGQP